MSGWTVTVWCAAAAISGISCRGNDIEAPPGSGGDLEAAATTSAASNTWVAKHSLPQGRIDHKAGTLNNIIYVVGGRASIVTSTVVAYDRATNTYRRSVLKTSPQVDAADRKPVAPKNVIVMLVQFGPLNDGHPSKKRLEATVVGKGTAWIATNGKTIKGTWRKRSITDPTRFFDAAGKRVTLTVGQTFVQVMPTGTPVRITNGKAPPGPIIIDRER